ncbi:MAG TPA: sigma 54-interacting transcriptional regulator [Burkholderiaceae bacterium]|nr:sigma 54-interacting transcriptional regulator [Burkholderiaceae bacterium]
MNPSLPSDADSILKLAARSLFELLSSAAQGMLLVDRSGRVVWINDAYKRFLPALGFEREEDFVGRPVADVVPNTLMHRVIETGQPILVDLLTNKAGTFVVSRIPLRDEAGAVIGALGIVLFDQPQDTVAPLVAKFARLQQDLEDARRELAAQRRPKYTFAHFIGTSPATLEVKRQARRAAATDSTVLLLGETGTGKELLAQAIHAASRRAAKPFIGVNVAAIPETLLEAEFFGAAPGAYTGAQRGGRDGKFKLADGGTLFLDEIGDMPLTAQAKLLRALQEQEIEPLGSNRVQRVDVRVIAATSRDLARLVDEGRFRADLFYRLNVLPIRVPPLRERSADLEALAESLLADIAARSGMPQRELTADALQLLAAYPWPGNVRELRNALEQAAMLTDDLQLTAADFARVLKAAPPAATADAPRPLPQRIAELERESIRAALTATGGNKVSAAKLLGISRATLYEKLAAMRDLS